MEKKKAYQKPQIKAVSLMPQEAVLQHCKSATGTNRSSGKCREVSSCTNRIVGS